MDKRSLMALILGTALTGSVSAAANQKDSDGNNAKNAEKCEQMKCGTGKCGSMKPENCEEKKYEKKGFQNPEDKKSGEKTQNSQTK